ncbi:MAG: 30S ribosome-binding factor RbfA [Acutalibacteraceae bacterium]|nr:30S ribosome-binding factor RbfA [Acutalibacteraceae bacterium]
MAGYKIDRITSDVRIAMADILRDIKDPRVSKMLSIIKVQVTNDLSYATFYVSAIEGKEMTESSVKALKGAAGYIRRELGARVKMRKVPEVRFVADDSIAFSAHLSAILDSIEGGENADEENG